MACDVLSGLLLKAVNQVQLQPYVAQILSTCVSLLSKALEPAQLKRTLWLDTCFYPRDEKERVLVLCGVDRMAEAVPGNVMARLKEFANIVGHEPFGGLVGSLKPEIGTKLTALGSQFSSQQSPMNSPIPGGSHNWGPQAHIGSTPPISPLPAPALAVPQATAFSL